MSAFACLLRGAPGILPLPAMRLLPFAIAILLSMPTAPAQNDSGAAQTTSDAEATTLRDYESCSFDDGLQIVKIDSLPRGEQQRTINTTEGPKVIHMLAGRRIMFAYGVGGDFFANVKPEVLPDATWATEKQNLLNELAAMLASDHDTLPNTSLPGTMHDLEVHGLDRTGLKGGTLGIYLLFDNTRHIATSVYFLNQQALTRRFQTIEQYRSLRARFLATYTGCIAQNRKLRTASGPSAR
ncbi:MAG TPA: hypothetical protein VH139_08045 [Acidobacteriaceae bacterium]|nr:hypothetical protein [Acidobacteriaceae bacterium]